MSEAGAIKTAAASWAADKAHATRHQQPTIFDPDKHSLVDFTRIRGGLRRTAFMAGELARLNYAPVNMLLFRTAGRSLDALLEDAIDEGFLTKDDNLFTLVEALELDATAKIAGSKRRVWSARKSWEDA